MGVARAFFEKVYPEICDKLKGDLPPDYTYHSLEHTLDVIDTVNIIGQKEGLSGHELELLAVAALFHDTGFFVQRKEHEKESCLIFRSYSNGHELSETDIQLIEGCIMATKVPQEPHSLLEEVLCDADLDYLGRDDFEPIAEHLYKELLSCNEIKDRDQWNRIQVDFLSKHRYHTKYALSTRAAKLQANLESVRQKLQTDH